MPGSNTVDSVNVDITGDTSDLDKALQGSAINVGKWAGGVVAAGVAATAALVTAGLKSADAQAKLATQLGTTSKDIAALQRASDLAGVSQSTLEGASKALTVRLSQAATGTGTAVAALDKLGLSANDLMMLPLSERMALINDSILKNADASERASLAAQFFGEDAGLAVSKINPATFAQAAKEVDKFGAALSETDAAKIEAANDAISQAGLAFAGVTQQLAAQFAPILTEVSNNLFDAAAESGLFENAAETAFNIVIAGAGYVGDALRVVNLVLKSGVVAFYGLRLAGIEAVHFIVKAFDDMGTAITGTINGLIEGVNNLPGVEIDKLITGESKALQIVSHFSEEAKAAFNEAKQDLVNLATEPLPSDALDEWAANIKEKAELSAQEVVKAKEAVNAVPLSPIVGGLSDAELEKQKAALQTSLDTTLGYLQTQQEIIDTAYLERANALDQSLAQGLITQDNYNKSAQRLEDDHQKTMTEIQNAANMAKLQVAGQLFGNLATLMQTENKTLFEIGKVAAISQATINGIEATISSYKAGAAVGGPVVGAAFAATAAIATGVQIAKLSSTSYGSGAAPGTPGSTAPSISQDATAGANNATGAPSGTLTVQGLSGSSLFTGDAIAGIAEELLDYQRRGGNVVLEG